MHPENAIDNGDFIKILVYKFILGQANDILQFMIQSGIINSDDVQKTIIIETERVATRIPDILKTLKSGV